jgi:hypothetical protein
MERVNGFEPSTCTLARYRSSQLSYTRANKGCTVWLVALSITFWTRFKCALKAEIDEFKLFFWTFGKCEHIEHQRRYSR